MPALKRELVEFVPPKTAEALKDCRFFHFGPFRAIIADFKFV